MEINNYHRLEKRLHNMEQFYYEEMGKKEILQEQIASIRETVTKEEEKSILLDKVAILFQMTADYARDQAKNQIEHIVSKCLEFIFDDKLSFSISMQTLRNAPHAEFLVASTYGDDMIENTPENSRGGGVVDVISLAIRIAFMEVVTPYLEGPLILDEPGKHISEEYIYNLGNFLLKSADMFQRQIIMVTHNQHLAALGNVIYYVKNENGLSLVEEISSDNPLKE